eukprot:TRINITY_DN8173_c0_g1_i1.p1 TRINITY_DN8173_c0_g1~~TRINITY_DN8173_c0_g1_i1.p1  ORF type:complete len:277 (+),score=31.14 TRINITY_DN8173_c0_g1_i1:358-1188(+)
MEFGLAYSSFTDAEWRPATLEELIACKKPIAKLGIRMLHDVPLDSLNTCIHIGGGYLCADGDPVEIRRKAYKVGAKVAMERDGMIELVLTDAMDRNGKGYLHVFVKLRVAKRRRREETRGALGLFLWKERNFTDAVVVCNEARFDVHRAVLARNIIFNQALSSVMVEGQTSIYEFKNSEPKAVEALLRYIYTDEVDLCRDIVPSSSLPPLLELAVQYDEPDLVSAVASALAEVCENTVETHARALKLHREHPEVRQAYARMRETVCANPALVDKLI